MLLRILLLAIAAGCAATLETTPGASQKLTNGNASQVPPQLQLQNIRNRRDTRPPTRPRRCLPSANARSNRVLVCDAVTFKIFPPQWDCLVSPGGCGLIFDIHGATMNAETQNRGSKIRRHGNNAGYIVVNPQQSARNWVPSRDHPRIVSFLREMIESYAVEPSRVHVTGFSQGAFATWNILCLASDVVCSAAPLCSSGLDPWSADYINTQNCFATGRGPATKRSIMYHTGTFDSLASVLLQPTQANNVFNDYGINRNQYRTIPGSDIHNTRREYTVPGAAGVKFQTGVFGYSMFLPPAGHCFPATGSSVNSANYFACPWIGSAAYDWGQEVVRFFERNRCPVSAPSPTPPPPTPPPVSVSPLTSWGGKIEMFSSADCADGTEISLGRSNVFAGNFCQEDFGTMSPTTKIGLVCSSDLSTVVACSGTNADGSTAVASCTTALWESWESRESQWNTETSAGCHVTTPGVCFPSATEGVYQRYSCSARPRSEYTGVTANLGGTIEYYTDASCEDVHPDADHLQGGFNTSYPGGVCSNFRDDRYIGLSCSADRASVLGCSGTTEEMCRMAARWGQVDSEDAGCHVTAPGTCTIAGPGVYVKYTCGEQDMTPMPIAPLETPPPTSPASSFSREDGGTLQYFADDGCNIPATVSSTTITSVPGGRCAAREGTVPWTPLSFFNMGVACQEDARSDEVLVCFGPTADQCACEVVSQSACLDLGEQYVRILCNSAGAGNGGDTSACQEAWAGASGGRFIVAASEAAGCGPCGQEIETYADCMAASQSAPASLGFGPLGDRQSWDGPHGCHVQEGSSFQWNDGGEYGVSSAAGHTPVCHSGNNGGGGDGGSTADFNPCLDPASFDPTATVHSDCNIPLSPALTRAICEGRYAGHFIDNEGAENRCIARSVNGVPIADDDDAGCAAIGGALQRHRVGPIVSYYHAMLVREGCNATLDGRTDTFFAVLSHYTQMVCGDGNVVDLLSLCNIAPSTPQPVSPVCGPMPDGICGRGTTLNSDDCGSWRSSDGRELANEGRSDDEMRAAGHSCEASCGDIDQGHRMEADPNGGPNCSNVYNHYGTATNCCNGPSSPTVAPIPLSAYTIDGGTIGIYSDAACTVSIGADTTFDQGGTCSSYFPAGSSPLWTDISPYVGMQCTPDGNILACYGLGQEACENAAADPAAPPPQEGGGCIGGAGYSQHREGCSPDEQDGEITRYLKWECAVRPTPSSSEAPTMPDPTLVPTPFPTSEPTTSDPTTPEPTTSEPTTSDPAGSPTLDPTPNPTTNPTAHPTAVPSYPPTANPTPPPTRAPAAPPTTRPPVSQPPNSPVPDPQDPTSPPTDEGGSSAAGSGVDGDDDTSAVSSTAFVAIIVGAVLIVGMVLGVVVYIMRDQKSVDRGGGRGGMMNPSYTMSLAPQNGAPDFETYATPTSGSFKKGAKRAVQDNSYLQPGVPVEQSAFDV